MLRIGTYRSLNKVNHISSLFNSSYIVIEDDLSQTEEHLKKEYMKTALIIGGTGLTGSHLLNSLVNSDTYEKIIAFSYRETEFNHPKLVKHIVDFDKPEEFCDLVRGDDFFCTIGTTIKKAGSKQAFKKVDYTYPQQFAKCAMENGVPNFLIISALGADATSSNYYMQTKGDIEKYLKQGSFKSVSVMRPSLLIGDRDEFRFAEKVGGAVMKLFSFAFIGPLEKYKPIKGETLANAMFTIAQKDSAGFNVYLSDELQELGRNK